MPIYVNKNLIKPVNFPGGECHVTVSPNWIKASNWIEAFLYSSDDIIRLFLTVDAVKRIDPTTYIYLSVPYIPYGRQDKVFNSGEALGISVISSLLKTIEVNSMSYCDAHSLTTDINLPGWRTHNPVYCDEFLRSMSDKEGIIACPDEGAVDRVKLATHFLDSAAQIIYFEKERDVATGEIIKLRIKDAGEGPQKFKSVIIYDDICDGGRTFIEMSKILREENYCDTITLWVTHGIFSKGLDVLRPHIDHIYCYHTWLPIDQQDPTYLTITGEKYV